MHHLSVDGRVDLPDVQSLYTVTHSTVGRVDLDCDFLLFSGILHLDNHNCYRASHFGYSRIGILSAWQDPRRGCSLDMQCTPTAGI